MCSLGSKNVNTREQISAIINLFLHFMSLRKERWEIFGKNCYEWGDTDPLWLSGNKTTIDAVQSSHFLLPIKFKKSVNLKEIMVTVFSDQKGLILMDFLVQDVTDIGREMLRIVLKDYRPTGENFGKE